MFARNNPAEAAPKLPHVTADAFMRGTPGAASAAGALGGYSGAPAATPASAPFADPIFERIAQIGRNKAAQAPTIPGSVVSVLAAATTLAEEIEDVIQKAGGFNFRGVIKNPVGILTVFGDLKDGWQAVAVIAQDGREAVEEYLTFDDAQKRAAVELVRRELDLTNDVAEAAIESAIAVGLTLAFTVLQFVNVVIPAVSSFIAQRKNARA